LNAVRGRLSWTGPAYIVPNGSVSPADADVSVLQPVGDPELVCVTRLVLHKRLDLLLDLAERLAERHRGLALHIVGDGPEAPALADGIAQRGLVGTVIVHGYVPEEVKTALVARAHLHLSTSQGEGWGLSVIEAAALGVPTVARDVDGLRDAVRDGVTGWLTGPDEDPVEIVERVLKELADPARRAEVAAACRAWAAEFDWERTAGRMAGLLAAAVRAGTSATDDERAHVIHRTGDEQPHVAEGPARDELLVAPDELREVRVATPTERLLGRPAGFLSRHQERT